MSDLPTGWSATEVEDGDESRTVIETPHGVQVAVYDRGTVRVLMSGATPHMTSPTVLVDDQDSYAGGYCYVVPVKPLPASEAPRLSDVR